MITKKTIDFVQKTYTRGNKVSANKVKEYLEKNEPEFYQYLKQSTNDDWQLLVAKCGIPPVKELMEGITAKLVGAKIEGFLIYLFSKSNMWANKFGLDIDDCLDPEEKYNLFLEGKLDKKYYQYTLTEEEKNNPENLKNKALINFQKQQEKLSIERQLSKIDKALSDSSDNKPPIETNTLIEKKTVRKDLLD